VSRRVASRVTHRSLPLASFSCLRARSRDYPPRVLPLSLFPLFLSRGDQDPFRNEVIRCWSMTARYFVNQEDALAGLSREFEAFLKRFRETPLAPIVINRNWISSGNSVITSSLLFLVCAINVNHKIRVEDIFRYLTRYLKTLSR